MLSRGPRGLLVRRLLAGRWIGCPASKDDGASLRLSTLLDNPFFERVGRKEVREPSEEQHRRD